MKKLTKGQIAFRARKGAKALIANKKKAKDAMSNRAGGRCCLCVLEDVAVEAGKAKKQNNRCDKSSPDNDTINYFGWDSENPYLFVDQKKKHEFQATEINDSGLAIPHRIIAEYFLLTFTPNHKLSDEAVKYGKDLLK